MKRDRKSFTGIVVALSVAVMIALAGIALAGGGEGCDGPGGPGEHGGSGGHHGFKMMAKKLGMTDAQKANAKAIFQGNKEVMKPIIDSLRAERDKLRTLLHADAVDEAAIRSETAKIAGIEADLNVNRAKTGVQFRAILTPEQLTTLKAIQKEKPQRGSKHPPEEW
ncbi:MAG: Spy/CpxP family protein refolding chaperone [Desulfuromonadales bacterium]